MTDAEKKSGETAAHRELKRLALAWAQANGFTLAATEVRVPSSRTSVEAVYRGFTSTG